MDLSEWKQIASRGTSGDMVWDILADWESDLKIIRDKVRNTYPLVQDSANAMIAISTWLSEEIEDGDEE